MQKKYWIIPGIIATALVVSLLALSTPKATVNRESKPTCCKKVVRECPIKGENSATEESSLDNLSNQFISLPIYN